MKKTIAIIALIFISATSFAQNKNAKASLEVDGVCGMCKNRIEKACFKIKGVKSAIWDVKTHELQVIYNEEKTNLNEIHNSIAAVGHDTKEIKASDEAYDAVHACCKYRDDEVVDDHKDE
ncbi:heavy-metal-associated domain-containing protein [Oceanihabitans sediminis]|uniref:ATPase n=1 Tax=Oceanihabitans sediminis TaxID=1812012 RepID=A0A368P4Y4_9FLAO|nr:heavy-metal-associated domain-containing protein [Oceanihabitans sediminis]MDX1278366.1 heavy-metal-associated domain-containing protein [Oceanihabitans sediminis]MDX1772590.1 heavy-metal-associated domain-containing protein [Oceanihabitans sediminis]RBP34257.1 copper chaperone CopZ [Oceanihabitans sediminis]RCU57947.1 ATPase [Oceanihabitans sediminis]